jgi:hypothetical protein
MSEVPVRVFSHNDYVWSVAHRCENHTDRVAQDARNLSDYVTRLRRGGAPVTVKDLETLRNLVRDISEALRFVDLTVAVAQELTEVIRPGDRVT